MENFEQIWPIILMALAGIWGFVVKQWPSLKKIKDVARYVDDVVDLLVLETEERRGGAPGVAKHDHVKSEAMHRLKPIKKLVERAQNQAMGAIIDTSIKAAVGRRKIIQGLDPVTQNAPENGREF